jgi:hypothetical protein
MLFLNEYRKKSVPLPPLSNLKREKNNQHRSKLPTKHKPSSRFSTIIATVDCAVWTV